MIQTDIIVLGSGISGLTYAIKAAEELPDHQISIITKGEMMESNTAWAQGGISVVLDFEKDSYEKHIQDTLVAGDGLCDEQVVEYVVREASERFREMVSWGADFDKEDNGSYDLGREGGHSENRVAHHKDITGFEIQKTLTEKAKKLPNIQIYENHYAIDLITEHHISGASIADGISCYGAYILDKEANKIKTFIGKITVLGLGGAGQVYEHTTNPTTATGDGIGMAYRAKAAIANMQYYQFHPTALYGVSNPAFLISEAVRGFGAKLRTIKGEPFMHKYDPREELASRDIVARAIDNELKITGAPYVTLDCRHLDQEAFLEHFPTIYETCLEIGIDCFKTPIPVVPAAHYMCGGVKVDLDGKTSLENLYAIGEVTFSGLHGANRLASNSLLEGLVFGHKAAMVSAEKIKDISLENVIDKIPLWNEEGMKLPEEMVLINYLRKELRGIMSDLMGIVRSDERMALALKKEEEIFKSVKELYDISILTPQLAELRNLISTAYLIITHSRAEGENRGAFFNKDLENQVHG